MFLFGVYEKIGTCLLYFAKVVCMISTNPKLFISSEFATNSLKNCHVGIAATLHCTEVLMMLVMP